jgi:hypothetical protein
MVNRAPRAAARVEPLWRTFYSAQDIAMPPLKKLPSETFFEHCMTGFEGHEAPPARLPEFYRSPWFA